MQVEPYHWIIGRPDDPTAAAWRRKLTTIRHNYMTRFAPYDVGKAAFFDALLQHVTGRGHNDLEPGLSGSGNEAVTTAAPAIVYDFLVWRSGSA